MRSGIFTDALQAGIDAALDRSVQEQRVVGAVLLIARKGERVYERAIGMADRESQRNMQLDSLFRFSSVTKPIVTAAAMALIAQGKLSLDDATHKWLPKFRPRLSNGESATITIRQLMTHTSGMGYVYQEPIDGPYHRARVSDGLDQPGLEFPEALDRLASCPLLGVPGTAFRYSLSIDVLGAVIERVCNEPLRVAVSELITEPLSMRDAAFNVVDESRLVTPYVDGVPPQRMTDPQIVPFGTGAGLSYSPSRVFNERSFPSGGTGMVGTAADVLSFLECIRTGGGSILPAEMTVSMMSDQINGLEGPIPGWGFGFGGAVLRDPRKAQTPQPPGTWLWGGVYGHTWFVDPVEELTFVLLTNTALEGMIGPTVTKLRDAVYEGIKAGAVRAT